MQINRYLIVIDDVWTAQAWREIQSKLPAAQNNHGSRIIVTTRIQKVAEACSDGHNIYEMNALPHEESKSLFLRKVFGNMNPEDPQGNPEPPCPEELNAEMETILRKCGGMPLAIVSIASILKRYRSGGDIYKWKEVSKSIGSDLVGNNPELEGIEHIVELSYNHLSHELKGCMMYLSIFPDDYEIDKKRLLSRWIAEGLVPDKRGRTQMEVAEAFLDELVSMNMVRPSYGYDDEKVESCRVHHILLAMLVRKSLECNFVSLVEGRHAAMSYERIRRLSIQGVDEMDPQGGVHPKKKMVEHVRSLSMFRVNNKHKMLDNLHKFTLLRVLDLEGCERLKYYHLKNICRLYLLRFLSVKGTNVKKMPSRVKNLEHLQTLDARDTRLRGLPKTVTSLVKLERILFKHKEKWDTLWKLRPGIKKMKALRELELACLEDDVCAQQVATELGELLNLQHIGIYIFCRENKVLETLASSLSNLDSLQHLNISRIGGSLQFLDHMSIPRQLRSLRLEGVLVDKGPLLGKRLPGWVGSSLTCLVKIVIMHTELTGDNLFDALYELPKLKIIVMQKDCYVGREIVARPKHKFPALSQLIASNDWIGMKPEVFEFQAGSMENLETLSINFGEQERSIVGIENLSKLKEVILVGKKGNTSVKTAFQGADQENKRRLRSRQNQFQVVEIYYD
ncbi:unnamed protein product [Urochloa humidicola]